MRIAAAEGAPFSDAGANGLTVPAFRLRMIAMNSRLVAPLLCSSLLLAVQGCARTILPDACGDDSIKFDVSTKSGQSAPVPPEAGKAQIVFIETSSKPRGGCFAMFTSCDATARFGVDGSWVGATRGNSYFTLPVDPGVHHLCVTLGKDIGVEALSVEAGKVYYYQANFNVDTTKYGTPQDPNLQIKKTGRFSLLSEDEGKFRVKASALSIFKPNK